VRMRALKLFRRYASRESLDFKPPAANERRTSGVLAP